MTKAKKAIQFDSLWSIGFAAFLLLALSLISLSVSSPIALQLIIILSAASILIFQNYIYLSRIELIRLISRRVYLFPIALYVLSACLYIILFIILNQYSLVSSLSWLIYFLLVGLSFGTYIYPMVNRYSHLRRFYDTRQQENIRAIAEMSTSLTELYQPEMSQSGELALARIRGVQDEMQAVSDRMASSYKSVQDFRAKFIANASLTLLIYVFLAATVSLSTYFFSFIR